MTIAQLREVSNRALLKIPKDVLLVALFLSVSAFAFGLGMLAQKQLYLSQSGQGRGIFKIESASSSPGSILGASVAGAVAAAVATEKISQSLGVSAPVASAPLHTTVGKYVASKNGTKYYLASCSGAKRIKDENKIWFASVEDAKASGRSASSACKGL
jgi:hypothetical protein